MSTEQALADPSLPQGSSQTRERILDEAEVLFASRGFAGTGVRDIATCAGLTPASLYNHFSNKDALYRAVLARGVQPLIERLGELSMSEDMGETSAHIIQGVMEHLAEHKHLPRLIALEAATGGEHLSELARDWIRPLIVLCLCAASYLLRPETRRLAGSLGARTPVSQDLGESISSPVATDP